MWAQVLMKCAAVFNIIDFFFRFYKKKQVNELWKFLRAPQEFSNAILDGEFSF